MTVAVARATIARLVTTEIRPLFRSAFDPGGAFSHLYSSCAAIRSRRCTATHSACPEIASSGMNIMRYRQRRSGHRVLRRPRLTPEWRTSSLSLQGQQWVSACMFAKLNAADVHLPVSLRGPNFGLALVDGGAEAFPLEG